MAEQQQQQQQQKKKEQPSPQTEPGRPDAASGNADADSSSGSVAMNRESPVFTYDESAAADFGAGSDDGEEAGAAAAPEPGRCSSKPFSACKLARLSQARKLRKTRLSLSNFIAPPVRNSERFSIATTDGAEIRSSNSNESASSFGSVPSDFDDLCNNS